MAEDLSFQLSKNVYSDEEKDLIGHTRLILDLPALAGLIKESGESVVKVVVTEFSKFLFAVRGIPIRSLEQIPEAELRRQFSDELSGLSDVTADMSVDTVYNLAPKELLQMLFDPKKKLYIGIEMVMQALAVSSVKVSCESC